MVLGRGGAGKSCVMRISLILNKLSMEAGWASEGLRARFLSPLVRPTRTGPAPGHAPFRMGARFPSSGGLTYAFQP